MGRLRRPAFFGFSVSSRCRRVLSRRLRGGDDMRETGGRQIRELLDIEDERDASIAEDGGCGDARHRAVALLDALDHHLLMAAQLVDDEPEARALPGISDDDDTFTKIADRRTHV